MPTSKPAGAGAMPTVCVVGASGNVGKLVALRLAENYDVVGVVHTNYLYYAEKGLTDQSRWPMFQFLREHEHRGQYPTPSRRAMEGFLGRRLPAA